METIHYRHFPLPCIATVLDNGLTVITANNQLPVVRVTLRFAGGALNDGDFPGLSHFLEHLTFEGPARDYVHPKLRHLMHKGVTSSGNVNEQETEYALSGYRADLAPMVDALGNICLEPTFDRKSVTDERQVIKAEITARETQEHFFWWSLKAMYPQIKSLHVRTAGTHRSLDHIAHDRLIAHHQRYYAPANAALIAAGDIDHQEILAAAEQLEKRWPPSSSLTARVAIKPATDVISTYTGSDRPPGVVLYFDGPGNEEPANSLLLLALRILVPGPLGLLFSELRTKRRMLYGTWYETYSWPIPHTQIGVDASSANDLSAVIDVLRDCLVRIASARYERELFSIAKAVDLRCYLETLAQFKTDNEAICDVLAEKWLAGRLGSDADIAAIISQATVENVSAAAERWLDSGNCGVILTVPELSPKSRRRPRKKAKPRP